MRYVLVLTVGPVQGFIAAARRSRDLWYGSFLLSELAKAAAASLFDARAELIFPAPEKRSDLNPDTNLQAANRIVAIINDGDVRAIAEQAKTQVQQRIQELWSAAQKNLRGSIDQVVADQQIRDLPEVTWVAVPLNDTYAAARERVEHLMAARKATNAFVPVPWPPNGQVKSSLDGQREAVIPEGVYPKHQLIDQDKEAHQRAIQSLFNTYRVNIGERLSGVDLLKRLGSEGLHIASTSDIAARSLLARINQQDSNMAEAWKMYVKWIKWYLGKSGNEQIPEEHPTIDQYPELLFAERISDYFDPNPVPSEITHYLESFLNTYADKKRPLPYYALLHADGDRMGETISHLADQGPQKHCELSQALAGFATNARKIIEQHQGVLIYAGGDDVLALLPLHTALHCTQQLAKDFQQCMSKFHTHQSIAPTLSAGLAIVHHIEPLSDALDLARNAEKIAKKIDGKNALAITVSKRSGSDRTISGTWGEIDQRLNTFIDMHCNEQIPDGAAYQLQELAQALPLPDDGLDQSLIVAARKAEALRLLKRKRANQGTEELDSKVLEKLKGYLEQMRLEHVVNELIVARMFASAADLAKADLAKMEVQL